MQSLIWNVIHNMFHVYNAIYSTVHMKTCTLKLPPENLLIISIITNDIVKIHIYIHSKVYYTITLTCYC